MRKEKIVDPVDGRDQMALIEGDLSIPLGPPKRVVDVINLPEPFATNLHNALCARGILTYADASRRPRDIQGALQEVLTVDVQTIVSAYHDFES